MKTCPVNFERYRGGTKIFFKSIVIFSTLMRATYILSMNEMAKGTSFEKLRNEIVSSHLIRNHISGKPELLSAQFKKFLSSPSLQAILPHKEMITHFVFSLDSTKVFTSSPDRTVRSWNVLTGELIHSITHSAAIKSIECSPDGTKLLIASGTCANLWNILSGKFIYTLTHTHQIRRATFSPGGEQVLTRCFRGPVSLWNASTGKVIQMFPHSPNDNSLNDDSFAVFSPDGTKLMISTTLSQGAKVWDVTKNTLLHTLHGHPDDAKFTPDSRQIITIYNNAAILVDAHTGALIRNFGHSRQVKAIVSPDGSRVITYADNGTGSLWDTFSGNFISTFDNLQDNNGIFSPDGSQLLIHNDNCKISLWDTFAGNLISRFDNLVTTMAIFSHDGTKILTRHLTLTDTLQDDTSQEEVKLWDAATGQLIHNFNDKEDGFYSAYFSPNDSHILISNHKFQKSLWKSLRGIGDDNILMLWDTLTGSLLYTFKLTDIDGRRVCSADNTEIDALMFSPDGSQILTRCNNTLKLWIRPQPKEVQKLLTHSTMNQINLLQAFELAIRERSRIHIYNDNMGAQIMETFKTFPLSVQRKLRRFMVQEEKPQSLQNSSSTTTLKLAENSYINNLIYILSNCGKMLFSNE